MIFRLFQRVIDKEGKGKDSSEQVIVGLMAFLTFTFLDCFPSSRCFPSSIANNACSPLLAFFINPYSRNDRVIGWVVIFWLTVYSF